MTKDELEQRVNDARAKNLDGTVSQKGMTRLSMPCALKTSGCKESLRDGADPLRTLQTR